MTHPHPHTTDMTKTQLILTAPMQTSALYNTLNAIASANTMDTSCEALTMAEGLASVAFTSAEIGVAAVVLDSATRKVESYMG